ncbi:Sortase family protein [Microbacterium azadirachtae]|uniref:Sortase family protein n=1 Tax=Microbacterium azadirachtae TaxID=582680 RepID=A0A0F0KTR9_9MICO|nr:class C sortase [Microbacterium azadirachtae]KJL24292.1 Sortase family protein [Microbacterium azadirachtae]
MALISLLGVGVALYPSTASWFSAIQEAEQVARYGNDVKAIGPAARQEALELADAYNRALQSGAEVKANQRIPVDTGAQIPTGFDYNQLLAANPYGLMGRILIPSINVDLPINHGTSDATLLNSIGHLEGTSLPIGGLGTHAVLAGHRGLASATLFNDLDKVALGEKIILDVFGETLTYKIVDIKIVDPEQTKALDPVPGKDLVTLVTCTPIGINSQRILVTGERVVPTSVTDQTAAKAPPGSPSFPGWAIGMGAALLAAGTYVWWFGRPVKRRHRSPRGDVHPATSAASL